MTNLHAHSDQTTPPCPPWCTLPAGHPYESETPDGHVATRMHEMTLTPPRHPSMHVSLAVVESTMLGHTYTGRAYLYVAVEDELNAAGARALAECLSAAADRLDNLADTSGFDRYEVPR